jgi:hypothetical protein
MARFARFSRFAFAAFAAAAVAAGAAPAHAQVSPYNFPVGGSSTDIANWYGSFNSYLSQLKDLSSLGINPRQYGIGTNGIPGSTGNILAFANSLSRQVGKLTNIRTIGDPRAEAEVAAIVRRWQVIGQIEKGRAAEQGVRNSVQRHELQTYYQKVASQARMDRQWALDAGRAAAYQKDYDRAIAYAILANYFGRVSNEYGQR